MKITAETITEAQLVELLRLGEDDEASAALRALRNPRRYFNGLGVGDEHMARQAEDQRQARAWCAAVLTVRIAERRCRECHALCDHETWDGLNCPWCRNTGRGGLTARDAITNHPQDPAETRLAEELEAGE